ncbi:hypothetical protein GCM10027515_12600 [Schumannella luteola]|uniref:Uncharacterized protein n=1 Tax=Schumannella luteola TaxID=472059 RepID=A0A852YIU9_9MICO|nr:hypothetical protein [Schumannella luteola]NYG97709.1 hypothetical protein [Schumannella luteola]
MQKILELQTVAVEEEADMNEAQFSWASFDHCSAWTSSWESRNHCY